MRDIKGFSYTPSRATSRTFFLLGYITAYVLYTAFTAAITSGLVQQETVAINVDDFKVIGYEIPHNKIGLYKIANHVNHLKELFLMIDDGTNIGIGPQVVFEQYISSNKLHDKGYNLIILAKSNGEYKRNFWIPKGLPEFQQRVNQRIIKIGESGILKFLMKKSLINMVSSNAIDSYSSASLEHVKSAILLFLTGLTFSVVFLIIELGVYGYRHRVTEQT